MAATYTGAKYVPAGVPDYEEHFARTSDRLKAVKQWDRAIALWKKFAESQTPKLVKSDPDFKELRNAWIRMRFPPVELLNSTSSPTATDSLPPTSPETPPPSSEPSEIDSAIAIPASPSPSPSDSTSTNSVDGSDSLNSIEKSPLPQVDLSEAAAVASLLTTEELLTSATWAMEAAKRASTGAHVPAPRGMKGTYLLLQLALTDPKAFFATVIGGLTKIEQLKIAAAKEFEEREAKRNGERQSGDRDLSRILAELAEAESVA